ncbi:MAG: acyl-CoA thioesterase [Oscillospiraceae bacterium]|nr:acyl-CoA thioesterase [Oscillospiraceae bacterium]
MDKKHPKEYMVQMSQIVMPADTNHFGNLSGGKLMHWIDICGAQTAMLYSAENVVTASIDRVTFDKPIKSGQITTLTGIVTWVGKTSMEVKIDVSVKDYRTGKIETTNSAYIVFVAVDENLSPLAVPSMILDGENEKEFNEGVKRREQRIKLRNAK